MVITRGSRRSRTTNVGVAGASSAGGACVASAGSAAVLDADPAGSATLVDATSVDAARLGASVTAFGVSSVTGEGRAALSVTGRKPSRPRIVMATPSTSAVEVTMNRNGAPRSSHGAYGACRARHPDPKVRGALVRFGWGSAGPASGRPGGRPGWRATAEPAARAARGPTHPTVVSLTHASAAGPRTDEACGRVEWRARARWSIGR